ncbi:MAG: HD domain-containing protein [Bdellovibrionales bacterium]|nr:HD domain-containing protein [Bdellovibrionales bacterium]
MSKGNVKKPKLMFVDDEVENLDSFTMHMEDDFDVVTCSDPLKALDVFKADENISLVLIDQVMPNMTGLELATEIKKLKRYTTMIMVTGNATKELAIESIRKKVFWEFLEKPVDFSSNFMKQLMYTGVQEHYLQKASHGFRKGAVQLLANLIDDKDGHTHRHSYRVQSWSMKIAKKFELTPHELMIIEEGALLHDIGKISIPDDILKKPGRLSQLERKIIMSHPARGGDLLESVEELKDLAPMARFHHERPDGTGYPLGLKGEEIPLPSSIVALADFYEALSSKRPYKDPWPMHAIVEEILRVSGKQFPEDVVHAFMQVILEEGHLAPSELEEIKKSVSEAA